MLVVHSESHRLHAPAQISTRGVSIPAPEVPARAEALLAALSGEGHRVIAPRDFGVGPIAAVHAADYLDFLRTAYERWHEVRSRGLQAAPLVQAHAFTLSRMAHHRVPRTFPAVVPHYVGGGYAPIDAGTWAAAISSAHCALEGAEALLAGESLAYALCRPPGHHAYKDMAGGYCYLNNAAIAAQRLVERIGRVAILDIDVHHGNGTQEIFYDRNDVLTISVHADPAEVYPFACGFADEAGTGAGKDWNWNIPLARGGGNAEYVGAIERAVERVRGSGSAAILVSLGFDPYVGDPSAAMRVTAEGFAAAGAAIGSLQLPTLLVQEGGYAVDALGPNALAFINGLNGARALRA